METGGQPRQNEKRQPVKEFLRQKAERFEFSLLATEDDISDFEDEDLGGPRGHILRHRQTLKPERQKNLWKRAKAHLRNKEDPFFDLPEDHKVVIEAEGIKQVKIPSLLECQRFLSNPEAEKYKRRAFHPIHMFTNLFMNIYAAFFIWFINMVSLETGVIVMNSAGAAAYFAHPSRVDDWYALL